MNDEKERIAKMETDQALIELQLQRTRLLEKKHKRKQRRDAEKEMEEIQNERELIEENGMHLLHDEQLGVWKLKFEK